MSHINEKIVYSKLQKVVNYHSWKQNMILLFKREQAYKIVIGEESKPTESAYSNNLTKLQFKDRLIADTVSSAGSTTLTPQSEDSIIAGDPAAGASAPLSPVILILSWDNIKNAYQSYIQEWELHDKWLELDSKTYNIMRRHTENDCKSALEIRTSFEAWSVIKDLYQGIIYISLIKIFNKMTSQHSETYKIKAALTAIIQQSIIEFCKLADVSSSLMRELEPFFLYQALGPEFYHLKEQVKAMKQSDINPEKMRSLINDHSIQTVK